MRKPSAWAQVREFQRERRKRYEARLKIMQEAEEIAQLSN